MSISPSFIRSELDEIVGKAEFFEFRVGEFSAGNEAHGEPGGLERQDGGHGRSLFLVLRTMELTKRQKGWLRPSLFIRSSDSD